MMPRLLRSGAAVALVLFLQAGCAGLAPPPAWEQPPPPPADHAIVAPEDLHRVSLANGLELILLEDHRLPRIAMGLTLRRGAGSVAPEFAGVADLATELMQRGAGDRDALALARVVEDAGARLSAGASWDTTDLSVSGLSEDEVLLFGILADVALRPRFDPEEFEKARSEQRAAIVSALDDPATLVQWHALETLYDGHRYGTPQIGTAETLARLDVERARAYWTDRFVPGNAIFWAVGDFDPEAMTERVRRVYGALEDRPVPDGTPPPPAPTPERRRIVVVDKPDLAQARIIVTHEGIARTDPARIALDLLNDALGGSGFSSRLMQRVRSNEGLTYGIGSGFSLRSQPGPFSVATFTRVPMVRRVVDLLLEELEAIRGPKPVQPEELRKFIDYNVGRFGLSLETSDAVLASLVDLEVHGLPDDSLDTFRARVRAVTVDDVARAATAHLHPERAAIIVLGPAEAIVPELEDLGEIEVRVP